MPVTKELIDEWRLLIRHGKTEEVISRIISEVENDRQIKNEITLLSSRYQEEKKEIRKGFKESKGELNRITESVLEILDRLEDNLTGHSHVNIPKESSNKTDPSVDNQEKTRQKYKWSFSNWIGRTIQSLSLLFQRKPTVNKCPFCLASISNRSQGKTLKCSNCASDLPSDFFKHNSKVITLVGSPDTGKSTFIAMLPRELQSNKAIYRALKLNAKIVGRNARQTLLRQESTLIERREVLGATVFNNGHVMPPLVIKIRQTQAQRNSTLYLSLFDTAGEEFIDFSKLTKNYPNIGNSDGIIFLIDPLAINGIYEALIASEPFLPPFNQKTYGAEQMDFEILENLLEIFSKAGRLSTTQKLNIPIAFCISKADLLSSLLTKELHMDIDPKLRKLESLMEQIELNSASMEELLEEYHPRLLHNIAGQVSKYKFFPVAPIGFQPHDHVYLPHKPNPVGILHPVLWILHKCHLIR